MLTFSQMQARRPHLHDGVQFEPRNGSWTGASARDTVPCGDISVRFSDALARPHLANTDDAGCTLLGEATPPESLKNVQSHP